VDARTFAVGMGNPGIRCEAARSVHLKGAKVVTGAGQTGVKDLNFAMLASAGVERYEAFAPPGSATYLSQALLQALKLRTNLRLHGVL
jgi:hypothetical protein